MSEQRIDEMLEPAAEALLRQTLAEHAPNDIDPSVAWRAIAPRISSDARRSSPLRTRHVALRRPSLAFAAAMLAAVALMGAGFAGGRYVFGWGLPSQHLWSTINQSQSAHGITITVTAAYADEGRTLIAYTIQLAPSLVPSHPGPVIAAFDLTDQYGEEGGGDSECGPVSGNGTFITCLMDAPAFHPPASVSRLDLTWTVSRVYVFASGTTHEVDGGWTLRFSVPFRHAHGAPGLPPAQPTPA